MLHETKRSRIGTVTLIGSGELSDSMSRVHRAIISRIEGPVTGVFLDTPAGFETNADEISAKAVEYFTRRYSVELRVASFKNRSRASALETEAAVRQVRRANFLFAGPGSPSYAIRNWRSTFLWDSVVHRLLGGAHIVFASAAAIATGSCSLPVYEIYKGGADPEWIDGLDLLGLFGLKLAVIPHWNNTEGGSYDTRYCYMGASRLASLEGQLTSDTAILGIDEYTACILDPYSQECSVMGAGQATVRYGENEWTYPDGATFGFERMRTASVGADETPAEQLSDSEPASPLPAEQIYEDAGRYLSELARALDETRELAVQRDLIDQAHDTMHELSGDVVDLKQQNDHAEIAPFVEELIRVRNRLRRAKQFAFADEIRQKMAQLGVYLEDSPDRTSWRRAS